MTRPHNLLWLGLLGVASLATFGAASLLPEDAQPSLSFFLVLFSVALALTWCIPDGTNQSQGRFDIFHPSVLFVATYLLYFVFPAAWLWVEHDYVSQWVSIGPAPAFTVNTMLFLGIISVAAFGFGARTRLKIGGSVVRHMLYGLDSLRLRELRYIIIPFVMIGGLFRLYHLSLFGPPSLDIVGYLSPSARRDLGINYSQFYVVLESMLDWAALFGAFYYLGRQAETNGKSSGGIWVLVLIAVVGILSFLVSGKRSAVVPLVLLPIIWRHYLIRRLSGALGAALLALIAAFIAALLLVRIAVPLIVLGGDPEKFIGTNLKELLLFYFDSAEWATFDMVTASLTYRDTLLAAIGGPVCGFLKYTFETLVVLVPRAIWPGKPDYEDVGQVYYHLLIGPTHDVGFAVTVWGTSLLFFHVAGLVLGMFLLGLIFSEIYSTLRPWERKPSDIFFYSIFYWMAFQFLRFGTMGFTLLLFVQTMLVGTLAGLFLARKGLNSKGFHA
ncbi:MAG: hypothetical protein ACRENK_11575 [Gemmatimonadaceae bacterium]